MQTFDFVMLIHHDNPQAKFIVGQKAVVAAINEENNYIRLKLLNKIEVVAKLNWCKRLSEYSIDINDSADRWLIVMRENMVAAAEKKRRQTHGE